MSNELIKRLRGNPFAVRGADYMEAADAIESLTAERDRLAAELAELRAQEPVAWEYTMPISGERIASVKQTLLPNERPLFAAPEPAAVPEGYVLVPRTPDVEILKQMHEAYWGSRTSNHWHENSEPLWRKTYWAMLAAEQKGE